VLVTGSSGHVGGAIARYLVYSGFQVVGMSRTPRPSFSLYPQVAVDISTPSFIERMRGFTPCDVIVHSAASLDKDLYAPSISLTNGLGTQNLLRLAEQWRTTSFIYISGIPVIGLPVQIPITEDHPVAPLTAYHASKVFAESLTAIFRAKGFRAVILRLSSPVGPMMPANHIFSVFARNARRNHPLQVMGQGTRCQNYVDVRDVAIAVQGCIETNADDLFLIGGKRSISNYDLAALCVEVFYSTSTIQFTGQPDPEEGIQWEISCAKAAARFGYHPRFTLEDSIRAVENEP
jgi:UDP-glucose 4-epimerase